MQWSSWYKFTLAELRGQYRELSPLVCRPHGRFSCKKEAGVRMGIPRHGFKTSRSASLDINASAWQLKANARNLASFVSRQVLLAAVSLDRSTCHTCDRSDTNLRNSSRFCNEIYRSNFDLYKTSRSSSSVTGLTHTSQVLTAFKNASRGTDWGRNIAPMRVLVSMTIFGRRLTATLSPYAPHLHRLIRLRQAPVRHRPWQNKIETPQWPYSTCALRIAILANPANLALTP